MVENGKKRIAIIGAGASGLAAIKTCLEYGFEPVAFEKTTDIGGLWRFKPNECEGEASVMKSTIINTSKEMMAYSDHPPPKACPNFMHNRQVFEYLQSYASSFNLIPYIRFRTEIVNISRSQDHDTTARWIVKYSVSETKTDGKPWFEEEYDGVMICTGHHVHPHVPNSAEFPGLNDAFQGRVMHSHSYKDALPFADKRVLLIGIGNSAVDAAVDLSRITSQVYVSTRRGTWLLWKVGDGGLPVDVFKTRAFTFFRSLFPSYHRKKLVRKIYERVNLVEYGLQPNFEIGESHPTESDELPIKILSGAIQIKPGVKKFKDHSVVFNDGSEAEVDQVILCTGYSFNFPFIEDGQLIPVKENQVSLYKYIFPPNLLHANLAIIGLIQPLGSTIPVAEMQCRVVCEVLSGGVKLPKLDRMLADIERKRTSMSSRYIDSRRHTLQVDYIGYMDELATMIGAKPNWASFIVRGDPQLAYALLFNPCAPYQYRLCGPKRWLGAREALLTMWDRIMAPTRTRSIPNDQLPLSMRSGGCLTTILTLAGCSAVLAYAGHRYLQKYLFVI